ncbi:MAG TPA: SRPBCC family protein [Myxococcales bacterium]
MAFQALHRTARRTLHVPAPVAQVFPLLCPVREREWLDGWEADVLHSESGLAELGCVFIGRAGGNVGTYLVTRYEPERLVEFAVHYGSVVERMSIQVEAKSGGTDLYWSKTFTALSPEGNAWIEARVPVAIEARLGDLEQMLVRFVQRA